LDGVDKDQGERETWKGLKRVIDFAKEVGYKETTDIWKLLPTVFTMYVTHVV
jgi:hypothetical protein